MNYYERHIGDYLKDTAHLSLLEHGVYTRLMDVYYTKEVGLEEGMVARLIGARTKEEMSALNVVLAEFFVLQAGVYTQSRCDREIERYHNKQAKAAASANARWKKTEQHTERNANAMRTHSEGNAPSNQTPVTNTSEANASGAGAPSDTADTIFALGVPLLTAASVSERNARAMLGRLRKDHGDGAVIGALQRCASERPLQPVPWLQAALKVAQRPVGSEPEWRRLQRERNEAFLGPASASAAAKRKAEQLESANVLPLGLG